MLAASSRKHIAMGAGLGAARRSARNSPAPWLVAAALLLWLGATAGLRLLALPDEGRYVGVAWEMLRSGDWLTPTLDGMPFFHKPPLFYWITAGAMELLGLHAFAGRVASLLGATLGGFALYVFVRRWCDERLARRAALLLAVQPLFYIGAQFANLDMLVAGCITATTLLLADAALRIERALPARRSLLAAYAVAALGVLAKGLIGFVLPGAVVVLWLLIGGRWRTMLRLLSPLGLLLFLAIAAPWFVAMQHRFPDFLHYFFVVQHFQRFAAGGFNNVQPVWFYPAVLALASLPALPGFIALLRRPDVLRDDLRKLMFVWFGVIVVFFSLPQSKLVGYVLPAVAPLALLMAEGFDALSQRWWRAGVGLSALVSVGLVVGLAAHPLKNSRDLAAVLSAHARDGEPLIMLKQYAYDLPFYARLRRPVAVVDDWSSPEVQASDNWRKELADAGRFEPAASARLLEAADLGSALCSAPVSFVLGEAAQRERWAQLAAAEPLATVRGTTLWRLESKALDCAGTPSAGSASR